MTYTTFRPFCFPGITNFSKLHPYYNINKKSLEEVFTEF